METTGKSEFNWESTCRICLQNSDDDMKYIFGRMAFSDDIVTKIIKCGGIPVDIMDGMPDRICNQCLQDLDAAYRFRSSCQDSYYQLDQLINNRDSTQKGCDNVIYSELKLKEETKELEQSPSQELNEPDYLSEEEFVFEELVDLEKEEQNLNGSTVPKVFNTDNKSLTPSGSKPKRTYTEALDVGKTLPKITKHTEIEFITHETSKKKSKLNADKQEIEIKQLKRGRTFDPAKVHMCYCCGNIYKSQSKLSQHIKTHNDEKPHECEICQKKFAQAAQLSRHMNSHTGNRPYKCQYCPSSFADPSTRIKHERIHTNVRPFECKQCGKTFSYSNVLKVHEKIHTGEKPFSCSICDKKFTQLHHKKSHERTHINSGELLYLD